MKKRTAQIERNTRETQIDVRLNLDGEGVCKVKTGIPFMDHMLELLGKHGLMDLTVRAKGDLEVDYHHLVEDLGLVLGMAVNQALGDRRGIVRYGHMLLPMDESLSMVALDLGGRPYLVYELAVKKRRIRDFDLGLVEEFFRAFATEARMNLHIAQLYGTEPHHAMESIFKGVARALRQAVTRDPRVKGVPSSKGRIG